MDYTLRCNDLKCRTQLHERAIVTTCSHVFCAQCADRTGLSRTPNSHRICPACGSQLSSPDDVVVAALNPSEDYKTSVLSGLSPTIIMECASRGLAFFSYQATQEILYQESLARSLTEKYGNLSQQMDQLIHDANAQIKVLQDKIQAMHGEQMSLENKNEELVNAFREKSKTHNQVQQLYQRLKAQLMSNQVTDAAGEQADFALQNARADRYVDRIPGTRTGTANVSHVRGHTQRGGVRQHHKDGSGSSGSGQPRGAIQIGPAWNSQSQGSGLGARLFAGQAAPVGTPSTTLHRSRLPVLNGTRTNAFSGAETGPPYQPSPIARPAFGAASRPIGGYGYSTTKTSNRNSDPNAGGR